MIFRNILNEIYPFLETKQALVLNGLRRTGKTTLIKHLLNKASNKNKAFFDLEKAENRFLFSDDNYENIIQALKLEGVDFDKKSFIAIDEVQLVPKITGVIKYLYDNYDIKFFITGSSSFYIKNHFSESLAGRKYIFTLSTLTFDEFLRFKNIDVKLPDFKFQKANPHFIKKLDTYYKDYILYGGFPEIATITKLEVKKKYLSDILNSYLRLDIKFLSDFSTTDEIFKLLKLLSARVGSKVDYSKLSMISGIHRKKIKEYLLFLEQTYFILLISPFVVNTDREIALQKKIYFADTGLLNILGNVSSGALFENKIANQLAHLGELNYYARRSGQEIDFILNKKIAFEVKETPSESDNNKLKERSSSIGIDKRYLIAKNIPPSGFEEYIWGGNIYPQKNTI